MTNVISRRWYDSIGPEERSISMALYLSHMKVHRESFERVCKWSGEDREGNPLMVAWVPDPCMRPFSFAVYELSDVDDPQECEGHESLDGVMGTSEYCDGSCVA